MAIRLNRREKIGLVAAAAVVAVVGLTELVVSPLVAYVNRIDRSLTAGTASLAEMHLLKQQYEGLRTQSEAMQTHLARRPKGFTLFSFLDRTAGQTRLKDRIAYMKPSAEPVKDTPYRLSRVEMKIQAVGLAQLVEFLHRVETAPEAVTIKRLSIAQTGKEEKLLEAVLQVETFEL